MPIPRRPASALTAKKDTGHGPDGPGTALFLSPHLDDVAFSCGGTVAWLAAAGWRCVVATVFTRSVPDPGGFALACQLDKGLSADVDYMALRRDEDAAFAREVGAEPVWLDLPEAPHRGYASAAALFEPPRGDDPIAAALDRALADVVRRVAPSHVFAPLALGGHVDHVLVADAVRRSATRTPLARYRDAPYALRHADDGRAAQSVAFDEDALARKLDGCAAYRTQLAFQWGGVDAMRAALAAYAIAEARVAGLSEAAGAERFAGTVPAGPGGTTARKLSALAIGQ